MQLQNSAGLDAKHDHPASRAALLPGGLSRHHAPARRRNVRAAKAVEGEAASTGSHGMQGAGRTWAEHGPDWDNSIATEAGSSPSQSLLACRTSGVTDAACCHPRNWFSTSRGACVSWQTSMCQEGVPNPAATTRQLLRSPVKGQSSAPRLVPTCACPASICPRGPKSRG